MLFECLKNTVLNILKCLCIFIGDNAVMSSIRIAQVFPELIGKKTHAIWKVYGEMLKYIIIYAFFSALRCIFFLQMMTLRCVDILVSQIILYSLIIYLNCFHMK